MMAQNDFVVVGIDIAKDKVDACIRSLPLRQTFPSPPGAAKADWLATQEPREQGGDGGERWL
jgi:hypothetical protein